MNIATLKISLFVLLCVSALGEEPTPPVRPPGVREAQWVPISDVLGIIITVDREPLTIRDPKTGAERKAVSTLPVRGIFAIRRNGTWHRLELEPNAATILDLAPR